jgi:hypothetical protein
MKSLRQLARSANLAGVVVSNVVIGIRLPRDGTT